MTDWRAFAWKAEAEAGWQFSKGHSLFGTAYVKPGDAGVGVGYRWNF